MSYPDDEFVSVVEIDLPSYETPGEGNSNINS